MFGLATKDVKQYSVCPTPNTYHVVHLIGRWFKHQFVITLNVVSREVHLSQ